MRIGIFGRSYPQKRLMMNIVKGTEYVQLINFGNVISHKLKCLEFALPYRWDVDGYHSMNLVPLTCKPWVTSFETRTPRALSDDGIRYNHVFMKNMVGRLMRNNCKGLLALSDCTVGLEQEYLKGYCNQQQLDIILPKVVKIAPPQQLYVSQSEAGRNDIVKFVFVGKDSIRKGVREIVDVMTELRKIRADFELYLISNLDNYKNYVFRSFDDTKEEMEELKMKIDAAKNWIHFHDRLPNEKVMEIIKQCDVGLLPTWHDTYGYSVLEFQSCGLPVLSTNCRALPEINKHGWRINLPNNRIDSLEEKKRQRMYLQKEMRDIIIHILDHHEDIKERGCRSFDYIKACHNPDDYAEKIKTIYNTFIE